MKCPKSIKAVLERIELLIGINNFNYPHPICTYTNLMLETMFILSYFHIIEWGGQRRRTSPLVNEKKSRQSTLMLKYFFSFTKGSLSLNTLRLIVVPSKRVNIKESRTQWQFFGMNGDKRRSASYVLPHYHCELV